MDQPRYIPMKKPWYIPRKVWDREVKHVECRETLTSDSSKEQGPDRLKIFEYLYQRLSILDAKVAVLLTVNSILLAAISVAGSRIGKIPATQWVFSIAIVVWLIATGICLWISILKWQHMHNVRSSREHYLGKLIKVTVRRTFSYNVAVGLILVLVLSLAFWALIDVWNHPTRAQDKAETDLTLILEDKRLIPKISNPAYTLEHVGKVGPFVPGKHEAVSEEQTDEFITTEELCQKLLNRLSKDLEIKYVILAGKVDKREPGKAVRQKYGSNLTLAQQRASWVKHALVSDPSLGLTTDKVVTVISGADVLNEDPNSGSTFASDRVVECYAVFKRPLSK